MLEEQQHKINIIICRLSILNSDNIYPMHSAKATQQKF